MSTRRRRFRRDPVAIGERLSRYRGGLNAPAGSELAVLQAAWSEIAGPQAAAHSVVVRRSRAGVVSVACTSGIWAQELDARRDLLAAQLTRAVPTVDVSGLRFVVGDHVIPTPQASRPRAVPTPNAEERATAERLLGDVTDPELRARLVRAAAGQMAVARAAANAAAKGRRRGT